MSQGFYVVFALALAGCSTPMDGAGVEGEEDSRYAVAFQLSASSVEAGEVVNWTGGVTENGSHVVARLRLESDLEDGLFWTNESLAPKRAGAHEITLVAVLDDGTELRESRSLQVDASSAQGLDIRLDDLAFRAGTTLGYTVVGLDAYGNETSVVPAVSVSSSNVSFDSTMVTGTIPGSYTISATFADVTDTDAFAILPGAPDSITLAINNEEPELYETIHSAVEVLDAYGNPTDDPWTLYVTGGTSTVSGVNATFLSEGLFYVTASVDGTSLSDSIGPILIDSKGPVIAIDEPERGEWVDGTIWGGYGTVSGTITDDWSDVFLAATNGTPLDLAADGYFSESIYYDFGVNKVETVAVDVQGNVSTDNRAVLYGDFQSPGTRNNDGIVARLNEGNGGIDTLEAIGEGLITGTDIDALIPSPVFSDQSTSNTIFGTIVWYSIALDVYNIRYSDLDLEIDPRSTGRLDASLIIDWPRIDWRAYNLTVAGIDFNDQYGTIDADYISAYMSLAPTVSNGNLSFGSAASWGVTVNIVGLYFGWEGMGFLSEVADFFGVGDVVADYIETAVEGAVVAELPPVLEEQLEGLALDYDIPVLDNTYAISARPYAVSVNNTGITMELSTLITPDFVAQTGPGYGSLYWNYSKPTYATTTPKVNMGISLDFLNSVLYGFWSGGLLEQEISTADSGFDLGSLSAFLPFDDLTVKTHATMPPVVLPGIGNALDLQLGDFQIVLYDGDPIPQNKMIEVYTTVTTDLTINASADNTLNPVLGDLELDFDVIYPDNNTAGAADTEALLQALVPMLLPSLLEGIGEIAIPEFQGFGLSGIAVTSAGAEGGYLGVGGSLYQN